MINFYGGAIVSISLSLTAFIKWGNIICSLKQIKHGKLKIFFVRLKKSFGQQNEFYGS